jgi:hypothetical protein
MCTEATFDDRLNGGVEISVTAFFDKDLGTSKLLSNFPVTLSYRDQGDCVRCCFRNSSVEHIRLLTPSPCVLSSKVDGKTELAGSCTKNFLKSLAGAWTHICTMEKDSRGHR